MSNDQLQASLTRINGAKFPANLIACEGEIAVRKERGKWAPRAEWKPTNTNFEMIKSVFFARGTTKFFAWFPLLTCLISSPVACLGILLGLSGTSGGIFVLIVAVSYLGLIAFSVATLFRQRFIRGLFGCYVLCAFGFYLDANYWNHVNRNLCSELRQDPTCRETKDGFACANSPKWGNMLTLKERVPLAKLELSAPDMVTMTRHALFS